jgi:hypothetical protein
MDSRRLVAAETRNHGDYSIEFDVPIIVHAAVSNLVPELLLVHEQEEEEKLHMCCPFWICKQM